LHPRLQKAYDLPRAPVLFEVDLEPLLDVAMPRAEPVSKLPQVRRDMAIVVDLNVAAGALLAALQAHKPAHVEVIGIFDVYAGKGVEPGKKSLAILVLMRDTERTLTDAEIEATMSDLFAFVADRFGATLRQ